jgi:hypothetical protein
MLKSKILKDEEANYFRHGTRQIGPLHSITSIHYGNKELMPPNHLLMTFPRDLKF